MRNKLYKLYLSEEEHEKLKLLSKAYKKPMSEVVRTAIEDTYMQADWLGMLSPYKDSYNERLRQEIERRLKLEEDFEWLYTKGDK